MYVQSPVGRAVVTLRVILILLRVGEGTDPTKPSRASPVGPAALAAGSNPFKRPWSRVSDAGLPWPNPCVSRALLGLLGALAGLALARAAVHAGVSAGCLGE